VKFAWIQQHEEVFEAAVMCLIPQVSRQGYYAWLNRPLSARSLRQQVLAGQIRQVHRDSDGTYGSPRVAAELAERNIACCVNTVARLMRQAGLRANTPARFVPRTTDSEHTHRVFDNLLDRDFSAELPNRRWVCDITYVPTDEGWLYLVGVMDLFSRGIVGWAVADHLRADLCLDALNRAIQTRMPGPGLLHHSDRGVQYACEQYQKQLQLMKIECSMSRVGNCYDNAAMESFWGTLKTEHVYRRKFASRQEAKRSIFLWIEGWYNRRRRHSALGYQSPEAFEAALN